MRHVADVVARHVTWCRETYRHPREHLNVRSALARLTLNVPDFTPADIRRGLATLEADHAITAGYRAKCWAYWLRFLRWAVEFGELPASVLTEVSIFRPRFREATSPTNDPDDGTAAAEGTPAPSLETVLAFLPTLAPFDRDFVTLLLLTAARPGELLDLRCATLDTSALPYIARLARHKTSSKTGPRIITFPRPACNIIDRYHRPFCPADWLFPAPRDRTRPISITTIQQRLRRRRAPFTLYDCRRIAARIIRAEAGLDAAQAMLGHTRASTTEIYAPVDPAAARRAADILARRIKP